MDGTNSRVKRDWTVQTRVDCWEGHGVVALPLAELQDLPTGLTDLLSLTPEAGVDDLLAGQTTGPCGAHEVCRLPS